MNYKKIMTYCSELPGVYEDRPFGSRPICFKLNGKVFAQIHPEMDRITLKTTPDAADFYRSQFPGVVVRGYHCPAVQQPYWNTINASEDFSESLLYNMIDAAYDIVQHSFSKKMQTVMLKRNMLRFIWVDGDHKDFAVMRHKLDQFLDELVGSKVQRNVYDPYNQPDDIHDVLLVYDENGPVACVSFKEFSPEQAELKRFYITSAYRATGLSVDMLRRIESRARSQGYCYMILETGIQLEAAYHLYEKEGYKIIENYGPYRDLPESICMEKRLQSRKSAESYD